MSALKHFRFQYSIWKLAARVATLYVNPSRCFLIVTKFMLSEGIKYAIGDGLSAEIPDRKGSRIVDNGQCIGVFCVAGGSSRTLCGVRGEVPQPECGLRPPHHY